MSDDSILPPTRPIPLRVRLRVLFGWPLTQIGAMFFGMGMVFVWAFLPLADLTSWYRFRGPVATAPGTITAVEKTGFSTGGSKHTRGTPVVRCRYEFQAADGVRRIGASYRTGTADAAGSSVTVEFPEGDPDRSRIRGMKSGPMGPEALIVLAFPIVGAGLAFPGIRKGRRGIRLLASGAPAAATFRDMQPTNQKINKQRVYRMTFTFVARNGKSYTAEARTHETGRLMDEAKERLLYDPADPNRSILLDELPGGPRLDPSGDVVCGSLSSTIRALILPAAALLGPAAYGIYWIFVVVPG